MVTRAYLDSLKSSTEFFPEYQRDIITRIITDAAREAAPGWNYEQDTFLRLIIPAIAQAIQAQGNIFRANNLRGLVLFAEGADLDVLGARPPVTIRRVGENDASYRLRIINSLNRLNLGSLEGIDETVRAFNNNIDDVHLEVSENAQDVAIYPMYADVTQLSDADVSALSEYMNADGNKIAGTTMHIRKPNIRYFFITIDATFDRALYSEATVESSIRASMYEWLQENDLISRDVFQNELCEPANVPEAITADIAVFEGRPDVEFSTNSIVSKEQSIWLEEVARNVRLANSFTDNPTINANFLANAGGITVPPGTIDENGNTVAQVARGDWFNFDGAVWVRRARSVQIQTDDTTTGINNNIDYVFFPESGTATNVHNERHDTLNTDADPVVPPVAALRAIHDFTVSDVWKCFRDERYVQINVRGITDNRSPR